MRGELVVIDNGGSSDVSRADWWREGILYQIYPRSFRDSDGDGAGDLRGLIDELDYLEWLGIAGVWLNPIMPSPNTDWGYDVSDYTGVDPDYGTPSDVDELISEAARRGIAVIFDIVPNHTSDQHPWFREACSSRDSPRRDWYVWADPADDGGPPNNWVSVFDGSPGWEFHEPTGQYYFHNFLSFQPDLNWWNPEVRRAFEDILRFWFDRGVAGLRIDVAHSMIKDKELRDNPPTTDDDPPLIRRLGQRAVYSMNRPEVHDILKSWRRLCDGYDPPCALIGETWVLDLDAMARFYGAGHDELHLAFNFPFAFCDFRGDDLCEVVAGTERALPPAAWPAWFGSNHDLGRFPTRWCGDDQAKARCALMMLLTLRGTPFLYYGDEIGMGAPEVPEGRRRDVVGRDAARTPMQWDATDGAGFTHEGVEPWLPLGDHTAINVADQRDDPASMLHLCRDLIALRNSSVDLRRAPYRRLAAPPGVWAWRRGAVVVALNLSERQAEVDLGGGRVIVATDRNRDGEAVRNGVTLRPWEGVVAEAH